MSHRWNRSQQAVILVGLIVVLGSVAWVLLPFHVGRGGSVRCWSAVGTTRQTASTVVVPTSVPGLVVGADGTYINVLTTATTEVNGKYTYLPVGGPLAAAYVGDAPGGVLGGDTLPCGTPARDRIFSAGLIALLTVVGGAAAVMILRSPSRLDGVDGQGPR